MNLPIETDLANLSAAAAEPPLKILVVHSVYQWCGAEDTVRNAEIEMLRNGGQQVQTYDEDNKDNANIDDMPRVVAAKAAPWLSMTTADVRARIREFQPDLIHAHNSFPLISPSLYWEAARAGVPVIQTLHNFRLLCPQALFLREHRVCEDCLGKLPWRGVVHRCYRESATQSAAVAAMLGVHRAVGTFNHKVTRYIALNRFCRDKFIEGGLPAERISIKPNFVAVAVAAHDETPRSGALYVGRLSHEKGVKVLLEALRLLPNMHIDMIGAGPMQAEVDAHDQVRSLGTRTHPEVFSAMRRAAYLVLPSVWHEMMPLTVVEAFACGLPVIASRCGALPELIDDGLTGLLCEPGDVRGLADKIAWAEAHPAALQQMGRNARADYLDKYTPERNFEQLMAIYRDVLATRRNADA